MEGQIYKAIIGVMNDIGAVGKTSKNTQQGFMFRGIDSVMNALNPALIKNKVFPVPEILEQQREERTTKNGANLIYSICKIRYTFFAEDGTSVQAVVIGEGMDSGDKATNKAMAIAYKYACFQVFCIPTEELRDTDAHVTDPDKECHETKPRSKKPKATQEETLKNKATAEERLTDVMLKSVSSELNRTGVTDEQVFKMFNIKNLGEMTLQQYKSCMKKLEITSSKKDEKETA